MEKISQLSEKIRTCASDLYEKVYKNRPDEWNRICVSMDILDDTYLALENYEAHGIGSDDGEKYLRLYGVLQSVFLQQDSIRHLYKSFLEKSLKPSPDSAWARIRDLRNLTVGHPIEKKDDEHISRCFISRGTITSDGFELIVWNNKNSADEIETIDIKSLYKGYQSEAADYLETICQALAAKLGELTK